MHALNKTKKLFFTAIVALGLALPLQAQGFDWKKAKNKASSSLRGSGSKKKAVATQAIASPAENEIRTVKYTLKSLKKKCLNDDKWWENEEKNQYWIISDLKKVKKNIEKIKSKDPNYSVAEFETDIVKVESRLAKAKQAGGDKKAHTETIKKLAAEFKADLKNIHAFRIITESLKTMGRNHSNYTSKQKMLEAIGQVKLFTALIKKCRSTYDAAMKDPDAWGRLAWRSLEKGMRETCQWDVAARTKILADYVLKRIEDADKKSVAMVKRYLDDLDSEGKWNAWIDKKFASIDKKVAEDRQYWEPLVKALGKELPAKQFTSQLQYWNQYGKKTIAKAAKKGRFESGTKRDSASLVLAKKSLTKMGFKVLKGVNTGGWTINKNHYGVPIDRIIGNRVMAKAKGETFCRVYEFTTKQVYSGAGKWSRDRTISSIDDQDVYLISRCR